MPCVSTFCLFPFNRCRRFGTDIVDYPVNSPDLVDNIVGYFCQELIGQVDPVGSHAIVEATARNATTFS